MNIDKVTTRAHTEARNRRRDAFLKQVKLSKSPITQQKNALRKQLIREARSASPQKQRAAAQRRHMFLKDIRSKKSVEKADPCKNSHWCDTKVGLYNRARDIKEQNGCNVALSKLNKYKLKQFINKYK